MPGSVVILDPFSILRFNAKNTFLLVYNYKVDFTFNKFGDPAPPAGFEVASQLVQSPAGSAVAIPDRNGAQLFYLIKRIAPDPKTFAAEKERCAFMCRFLKQSLAGAELTEDIAAHCTFKMNQEGGRNR